MTRLSLSALVSLSLITACTNSSPATNNPDAGKYDGYYSDNGGGSGGSGGGTANTGDPNGPKPRAVSSTKGAPGRKGRPLSAKKPPVPGGGGSGKPRPPVTPTESLVFDGFLPSNAPAGSVIEVFGSGFGKLGDMKVTIGGKAQKVLEVGDGHMLVQTTATADGVVGLVRGKAGKPRGKGRPVPGGLASAKSTAKYHSLPVEGGFGAARTNPAHGLVANVLDIGKEVTELPGADFFGQTPVATFAVDTVDVPAGQFTGGFGTGDLKQWFALHFRGSLNITAAGTYNFCLVAGDGAQLYLDQNKIVDNDGAHDTTEKCEELAVEPGEYQLDILYFQGTGDRGLQLMWSKDGGEKTVIPKENLFPPEDARAIASK